MIEKTPELNKALVAAQLEMKNPSFDSENPHFHSKFASLAAVRNAIIPVLAKHGLALTQSLTTTERGIACETLMLHVSGEWMTFGTLELPTTKADAQGFGSAATYARRYSLMAVAGVAGDADDDGEDTAKKTAEERERQRQEEVNARSAYTKKVNEYRAAIMEFMAADKIEAAADVMRECKEESEGFAADVWGPLSSQVKGRLRDFANEAVRTDNPAVTPAARKPPVVLADGRLKPQF